MEYVKLNTGYKMPVLGYGTYKIDDDDTAYRCVTQALETGYRLIDTAAFYENEAGIGRALKASGVKREEIFLTTKLWTDVNTADKVFVAVECALAKLKTDYLDLLLIHWPIEADAEIWRAMVELKEKGVLRSIGTSNFKERHIDEIAADSGIVPAVNQVEFHPLFQQNELRNYCKKKNICVQAWSPLMRGGALDLPLIGELAEKYGVTKAQFILRWDIQTGVATIPKSENSDRMKQNFDVFGFEIFKDDMKKVAALNQNARQYRDPDCHGF